MSQRAGFVEHDVGYTRERFQCVAASGEQPQARQSPSGGGQRGGCGEPQGARAGHHQYRHGDPQHLRRVDHIPDRGDERADDQQRTYKPRGGTVGKARKMRFFALRAVEQAHDGGEARVGAEFFNPDKQRAGLIEAAADDRTP